MEKIKSLLRQTPSISEIKDSIHSFSKREWIVFSIFIIITIISGLTILGKINKTISTSVPTYGGQIVEGIVGTPRFINPVLAISDADKDMTTLMFSGLMRKNEAGELIPDITESYDVSDDGLVYTFHLKKDVFFHDGKLLTADDVVYTINTIRDPLIKSPRKINWDGIIVKKIDDTTVEFVLKQPFAGFLDNTTVGIIPAHLWSKITTEQFAFSDLNIQAIGTGPYKQQKIKKSSGIVTSYELSSFSKFVLGKPYINHIKLVFYANEKDLVNALEKGSVDQISAITGDKAREFEGRNENIQTAVLPRIFGLYFNQNKAPIFLDKTVVNALELAINKDRVIREILFGYGVPIDNPIPSSLFNTEQEQLNTYDIERSITILEKAGWKLNEKTGVREKTQTTKKVKTTTELSFSISTSDTPELKQASLLIKEDLEKIGVKVELKVFELGALNQNVIRPRDYDVLFFGQIITRESDLYAFWHSSQRNDPGLNVSLYANTKVDKLLESALITIDREKRLEKYNAIKTELNKDKPAIFIYAPNFIYLTAPDVYNVNISHISTAAERFSTIYRWYIETDRIWNIFTEHIK